MKDIVKKDCIRRAIAYLGHNGDLSMGSTAYDRFNISGDPEVPNSSGFFDCEGLTWSDVLVGQRLDFSNKKDILYVLEYFKLSLKGHKRFLVGYKSYPRSLWEAAKDTINLIKTKEFRKCFAIASFSMAEEDFEEDLRDKDCTIDMALIKNGYVRAIVNNLGECGVFVNKEMPEIVFINEKMYPFDLRDGWSNKEIESLILMTITNLGIRSL